jgi:superfamily II RNA helicase
MLPAIFFLKSRADCNQALHAALPRVNPDESKEERRSFHKRLAQLLQAHPYLKNHKQLSSLRNGRVAAHHGGQLPQWKSLVETLMKEGKLDAIFSTSTVAAGVNFPARTVVLSQSDRFNGREFVPLTATDLLQMTGRAGRRGMDKVGFVVILPGPYQDPELIVTLLHSSPERISSQIHITFSMVLNLLLSHGPEQIRELLARSFATYQNLEEHQEVAAYLRKLEKDITDELEEARCGDLDTVLRTLSRKRDLERQVKQASLKLRRSWQLEIKELLPSPQQETWQNVKNRVADLEAALAALPCAECTHLQRREPKKRSGFRDKINKILNMRKRLDQVTNHLWHEFNRHFNFLREEGYVDEAGRLRDDGIWASQLRLDQPLLVAESIRRNVFPHDDPLLLAALMAPFVSDGNSQDQPLEHLNIKHPELGPPFATMISSLHPLRRRLRSQGFLTYSLSFWPAANIYAWIRGASWDELVDISGLDEGDLAMLIYRTADSLRQLEGLSPTHPRLAASATVAIERLLREPVVVPT